MDHHDEIEPEDLLKLYGSFDVTTPTGLQEKYGLICACNSAGEGERT